MPDNEANLYAAQALRDAQDSEYSVSLSGHFDDQMSEMLYARPEKVVMVLGSSTFTVADEFLDSVGAEAVLDLLQRAAQGESIKDAVMEKFKAVALKRAHYIMDTQCP